MKKIKTCKRIDDNLILINNDITRFIRKGVNGKEYIKYNNKCYTLKELNDIQYFNEYHSWEMQPTKKEPETALFFIVYYKL